MDDWASINSGIISLNNQNTATIEFLFKMPSINSGSVLGILNNHIGSNSNIIVIGAFGPSSSNTGHFYTHLRDDTNGIDTHLISQIRYDDNNWHHYKLVIDNDDYTTKQYIDGSLDNSYDLPPNYYFDVNETWRLGGNYFDGRYINIGIDELKFKSNEILFAYYNFNEGSGATVIDQTENGNDGTINGGATWVENIYGCTDSYAENYNSDANWDDGSCTGYPDNGDYSLSFDGVDDYVYVEDIQLVGLSSFTIQNKLSFHSNPNTNMMGILGASEGPFNVPKYAIIFNPVYNNLTNNTFVWHQSTTNPVNNWLDFTTPSLDIYADYDFIFIKQNNEYSLYINGILQTSKLSDFETPYVDSEFRIGSDGEGWSFLNGNMDELLIWDRVLSEEEISGQDYSNDGLIANWKFDAGIGDTLYDHSGNGNHGTINGATWVENISGCTHPNATNYDDTANVDDGSCEYETVQIGHQVWMTENLKVTLYSDGSEIPNITYNGDWGGLSTGAYCDYDNNPANSETNGRLYNWYAVDDERGVCPNGFHVPSDEEFMGLEIYLGMSEVDANGSGWGRGTNEGAKLAGNSELWNDGNLENNSEFGTSGFTGLPAGYRSEDIGGYSAMGSYGDFWSSSESSATSAWYRELQDNKLKVRRNGYGKRGGMSIRCLSDETQTTTMLVPENFATIQEAIDYSIDGDTILVSAGTYYENINFNGKNIALIGEDRETTIIDGDTSGNGIGNGTVVTFNTGENSSTLLYSFTITNGYAGGDGGGISILNLSEPIIKNCIISNNSAISDGGGIDIANSSPTIIDCVIENNSSIAMGGGIYNSFESNTVFTNCIIRNNTASGAGGMYLRESSATLTDVTFNNNSADYIGGIYIRDASPTLTDVTFSGNTANNYAGGMYLYDSNPILTGVTFSGNLGGAYGGGMFLDFSNPTLTDVIFSANTANSKGGGMNLNNSNPTLNRVTFSGNTSYLYGGGIHLNNNSSPTLISVTFSDNSADYGGGMYIDNSSSTSLKNSILWGNSSEIHIESNSVITVTYSDIQGGYIGTGNIDSDPLFTDPENGDYTLQAGSPCIDTGDPESEYDPDGTIADMGAYPFYHIWGCTDEEACNYDAEANTDDESCLVFDICGNCDENLENDDDCLTWPEELIGNWNYVGEEFFETDCEEIMNVVCSEIMEEDACWDMQYCAWNELAQQCEDYADDDGNPIFISFFADGVFQIMMDTFTDSNTGQWGVNESNELCMYVQETFCVEIWDVNGYILTGQQVFDNYCLESYFELAQGCMDELAANYDDFASADVGSCLYNYTLDFHAGANLKSFYALPEDVSIPSIMSSLGDDVTGVITEGGACSQIASGTWVGSQCSLLPTRGYWIILESNAVLSVFDAVPTDSGITYNLYSGANLISFPSDGSIGVSEGLPDDIEGFVVGVITEGGACSQISEGTWVGSHCSFHGTHGYWMITTAAISFSFDFSTLGRTNIAYKQEKLSDYEYTQSSKQAFYFIESVENIKAGDWILSYNGDEVIGSRQWQGSIIDVPAMGDDGNEYSAGYIEAGGTPHFKLLTGGKMINLEGDIPTWSDNGLLMVSSLSQAIVPVVYSLSQAYPNPFNPVTTLSFAIPVDSEVSLSIYNLQGREVSSLIEGNMDAGYHSIVWDANSYASGVYFVKMVAGEFVNTQKLMLIK